jgi:hypothetical protein
VGDVSIQIAVAAGFVCVWAEVAWIAGDEQSFRVGDVFAFGCFAILFCAEEAELDTNWGECSPQLPRGQNY